MADLNAGLTKGWGETGVRRRLAQAICEVPCFRICEARVTIGKAGYFSRQNKRGRQSLIATCRPHEMLGAGGNIEIGVNFCSPAGTQEGLPGFLSQQLKPRDLELPLFDRTAGCWVCALMNCRGTAF